MPLKFRRRIDAAGGIRIGDDTTYTDVASDGAFTLTGAPFSLSACSQVSKQLWLPATAFTVASGLTAGSVNENFEGGSMIAASLPISVSGSVFLNLDAASLGFPVIQPHTNVTGSMVYAQTVFPVPLDAATTGCVQARPVWTVHDENATTGSVFCIKAGMSYISSSAAVRQAASTGACPAYNYTASGVFHETNIGNLPSFGANDVVAAFILIHDQTVAADTGGSGIAFLGVKLQYVSNKLGASQT